jgi:hypothetical protein
MGVEFAFPLLVIAAATVALGAVVAVWRLRRRAPALFLAGAAFLLLAGAGPRLSQDSGRTTHLWVVDVSDSMNGRAVAQPPALPTGHVWHEMQLSDALRPKGAPPGGPTRYARLADALAVPDFDGELVLITDGRGSLAELAGALPPGRAILLPAPRPAGGDAAISALRAPGVVAQGSGIVIEAELHADRDGTVAWRLFIGERVADQGEIRLVANRPAVLRIPLAADQAGATRARLVVEMPGDREPRNDRAEATWVVTGLRVIEYARDSAVPESSDALLALLRADPRNQVRVRHTLPASAAELEGVALAVIHDLPLWTAGANAAQTAALADWARDGGSLLMVGADGAFAPGGYRATPLEDVMPVKFRPDDEPPRHNLLLLDVSSSMAELTGSGAQKLSLLRDAARRVVAALDVSDRVAVVGFHGRLANEPVFAPASDTARHEAAIAALGAQGRTLIGRCLAQALDALASVATPAVEQRILLVTDGEEGEAVDPALWTGIGSRLRALNTRLDVVLTEPGPVPDWLEAMLSAPGRGVVETHSVGTRGFDELVEAIERALAAQQQALVLRDGITAPGLGRPVPALVRTAARRDGAVQMRLQSATPAVYPLVAMRQLVGRTGVICTPAAGGESAVALWLDPAWQQQVSGLLQDLLEHGGRPNLTLHRTEAGAELVWVGPGKGPGGDLVAGGVTARRAGPGRWLLDAVPEGDSLEVSFGSRVLQRISLPRLAPAELARTGNDDEFFAQARALGFGVFSSLDAWQPARRGAARREPVALEWLAALAGVALLLAGFARRR